MTPAEARMKQAGRRAATVASMNEWIDGRDVDDTIPDDSLTQVSKMTRAERKARIAAERALIMTTLRIRIKDGEVRAFPFSNRRLGTLAGARAVVTDRSMTTRVAGGVGTALLAGPVAGLLVAGLFPKAKATAFVVFADGTFYSLPLGSTHQVRDGEAECNRFNRIAWESR